MDSLFIAGILIILAVFAGWILGVVAFFRSKRIEDENRDFANQIFQLRGAIRKLEIKLRDSGKPTAEPVPPPMVQESQPPVPAEKTEPVPEEEIPTATVVAEPEVAPSVSSRPAVPPAPQPPQPKSSQRLAGKSGSGESLEEILGKRWMTWAGALVLVFSVAFFVKYAFDNQWIGPTGRIVLGLLFGFALVVAGHFSINKNMRALGQGLLGAGLAALYVSIFTATSYYDIIPREPAFLLMVFVTALGLATAVLHNALPIAFIATLGGLLSPVLVSTGHNSRDALFAYLSLLNLGVLGVAFFKKWKPLDVLAFVGTIVLFLGWFAKFYDAEQIVPTTIWLGVFFLIFLFMPFVYHFRRGENIPGSRFAMTLTNAVWCFVMAYAVLSDKHQFTLGFVALFMGACYITLGALVRKRIAADTKAIFGFVTLSVVFLTIALPLQLKLHGLTLVWAVEGPVLCYLGFRYAYKPVRIAAFLVLLLSVARLLLFYMPLHKLSFTLFFNVHFASALFVVLSFAAYALIQRHFEADRSDNDRMMQIAAGYIAAFLALLLVNVELKEWFWFEEMKVLGTMILGLWWAAGCLGFNEAGKRLGLKHVIYSSIAPMTIAVGAAIGAYAFKIEDGFILIFNLRFILGLAIFAAAFYVTKSAYAQAGDSQVEKQNTAFIFGALAFALLILLSNEAYFFCVHNKITNYRWASVMSLSIVWALYAIALLVLGFAKRLRYVRYAALGLFAVTVVKALLFDVAALEQFYRILSFVALGVLLIGASYLYHRLEKLLSVDSPEPEESPVE